MTTELRSEGSGKLVCEVRGGKGRSAGEPVGRVVGAMKEAVREWKELPAQQARGSANHGPDLLRWEGRAGRVGVVALGALKVRTYAVANDDDIHCCHSCHHAYCIPTSSS